MEDKDTIENENEAAAGELAQKCEEYLAGWKRAQADYANLKKETDHQKTQFAKFANERLLTELLPAIDQFETALSFTPDFSKLPDDQRKPIENWAVGIKAVRSLWESAFKEIGLECFEPTGTFDPSVAEAVGDEVSETVPEGSIVRTMKVGWSLNGKLLRPAKVIIAK